MVLLRTRSRGVCMRSIDLIAKRIAQAAQREEAKAFAKRVDSATRGASRGGFDTTIRFSSDGRRVNKRWQPGMSVGFQRVHADPASYSQRVEASRPLPVRKQAPASVWTDIGSTFRRTDVRRGGTPRTRTVRAVMPGASLRTRLFG